MVRSTFLLGALSSFKVFSSENFDAEKIRVLGSSEVKT